MTRGTDRSLLRREVLAADDRSIRKVVEFVDRLADRGEADALIAPLRARLARIKPPRPFTLTRMLFLPIDPLIVDSPLWRTGMLGIPRGALAPLGQVVAENIGPLADEFRARVAGRSMTETDVVIAVGAQLWPAAARVLRTSEPPARWVELSGVRLADHDSVVRPLAVLLAHGPVLHRLALLEGEATDMVLAEQILQSVAQESGDAYALMLTLLMALMPRAGGLMGLGERLAGPLRSAPRALPDRALDFLLREFDDSTPDSALPDGPDAMRRIAVLLEGLRDQPEQRPLRTAKVERVRRRLDAVCRSRFEESAAQLCRPIEPRAGTGMLVDTDLKAVEAAALDLRRLDAVGRRLGGPGFYDTALRRTAERLIASPGLTETDRLRLAEILLGADAAEALVARAPIQGRR